MPKIGIIQEGTLVGSWDVSSAFKLQPKFSLMCKKIHQKAIWCDYRRSIARKIDPQYTILRNTSRAKTVLVLIDLDEAPENYMQELAHIYKWEVN